MIYTVTFNPAIDYIVRMDAKLVSGMTNRSVGEEYYIGGKGINVSTVLRNLGFDSTALGFIAGFTGDAIEHGLACRGIPSDFIHLPGGVSRINVKLKFEQETEINAQGPVIPDTALQELFIKLGNLEKGDILILAGSIPGSLPSDVYEQILSRLNNRGILFVVDATGQLLQKILKYHPFLIKPNKHELGELFGQVLSSDEEIIFYAKELQKLGAGNVLVSMAGDGAILVTEEGTCHRIAALPGKVKNSVGAGDSMVAGFLAGYLETKDYETALKMGTAAGSATAFSDDLATGDDIRRAFALLKCRSDLYHKKEKRRI